MITRSVFALVASAGLFLPALNAPLIMPADVGTNVMDAAYGAKGDGVTDDTKAIRAALDKARSQANQATASNCYYYPTPSMVYFPAGTYLLTDSLDWISCAMTLQGQGMGATVLKLKSATSKYTNATSPKAFVKTRMAGNISHLEFIYDMTILVGSGNPGAIGLDFIANNIGGIENVEIISEDLSGIVGLDMSRQWPGPCLIKNVRIAGFNYGIRTNQAEYGPTFEHITLTNQKVAGFYNQVNVCAVRDLQSTNTVPAVSNTGLFILIGGNLQGGASTVSAITNTANFYARNVTSSGYRSAISKGTTVVAGSSVTEYCSDTVRYLFAGTPKHSLNLPIEETPTFQPASLDDWAKIVNWGFTGDDGNWAKVFTSGKPIVYFPSGVYLATNRVIDVPTTVKRIVGDGSQINVGGTTALTFNVTQASADPLIIEKFNGGVTINHRCSRPLVIRHGGYGYVAQQGAGKVYFEDFGADNLVFYPGQQVWMRQCNPEGANLHITNNGAQLWILGIKTEGTGTVVKTAAGGTTEMLGTVIYPATTVTGTTGTAFICQDAAFSAIYRISCYAANGNYPIQIDETRKGVNKKLTTPNRGAGFTMPLFAGFDSTYAVRAAMPVTQLSRTAAALSPGTMFVSSPLFQRARHWGAAGYAPFDLRGRPLAGEIERGATSPRGATPGVVILVKQ